MKFYGRFAAAYGTLWLFMVGLALITQAHINTGAFGLFGFPLIALVYASIRKYEDHRQELRQHLAELEQELARSIRDR